MDRATVILHRIEPLVHTFSASGSTLSRRRVDDDDRRRPSDDILQSERNLREGARAVLRHDTDPKLIGAAPLAARRPVGVNVFASRTSDARSRNLLLHTRIRRFDLRRHPFRYLRSVGGILLPLSPFRTYRGVRRRRRALSAILAPARFSYCVYCLC
ncbi:hypothetical protein EVAR_44851_1 [Eumeta japonica]|uniref:Uncharacterized protein n=1 Tax=Eumeta variegata TaxID=151549 RepID=A0A4C1YN50_EUMVA|nr:hypothetical protein EVAR_44851_1 [Eumeta japonica]